MAGVEALVADTAAVLQELILRFHALLSADASPVATAIPHRRLVDLSVAAALDAHLSLKRELGSIRARDAVPKASLNSKSRMDQACST